MRSRRPPGTGRETRAAWEWARIAVSMAALAGAVVGLYFWRLASLHPVGGDHLALLPLIGLGAWGASMQRVGIRDSRTRFAFNLGGIPALLAIAAVPPGLALLTVFAGGICARLSRRAHWERGVVTCLAWSLSMGVGVVVYYQLLGTAAPWSLWGWLVGTTALAVLLACDFVVMVAAVSLCAWRWRIPPIGATVAYSLVAGLICSAGGTAAIVALRAGVWDVALLGVLVAAGDIGWRRAARAAQRHATLNQLYRFTESLALSPGGERQLVATVLEGTRSLLSAGRAALVVPLEPPLDELTLRCTLAGEGPVVIEEAVPRGQLVHLVAERGALIVTPGSADAPTLAAAHQGFGEGIVAPLRAGDPMTGYLVVAERSPSHGRFVLSDLQMLEALAANAAVALRKGGLIDKLRNEAAVREYEAHHDSLTGLPNRALFLQRLEAALKDADGTARVGVVLVDLDGFKQVNDTLGHENGDVVLSEVARRIGPMADARTLVARLGGDEFVLLLEGAADQGECTARGEEVLASIAAPMVIEGLELIIRASVGVATTTAPKTEPGALLRQADAAMYKAKAQGGGVRTYEREDDRSDLRRLTMAAELRKAIEAGALQLHYQVVFEVLTLRPMGCEALARWTHEQFGDVPPEQFIKVAERAGLIDPLTWWALDTALDQVKRWRQVLPRLSVSVNLSAMSLLKGGLALRVQRALDRAGLGPDALRLELTETSMMAEMGKKALGALRDLGVALSIDDFGTGYSSLSRLRHLPFDEVKIDRSFVTHMCEVSDDEAVVRSVIELARGLGKVATAEGVEDRATLDRLTKLGCFGAQGYYLARPLPAAECEAHLWAAPPGTRVGLEQGPG